MIEVMVVRTTSPHMLPNVLLWVQLRRVGRQPFELDLLAVLLQQPLNRLRFVCSVVVNKQHHPALWMFWQRIRPRDGCQQTPEAHIVAATMNDVHRPACQRFNSTPVPALGGTHTRCQEPCPRR